MSRVTLHDEQSTGVHAFARESVFACRLCLRFIPVEHVCSAKLEQMKELAAKVLPEALPARDEAAEPEMVRQLCYRLELLQAVNFGLLLQL